jgi:hypothetical protein
MFEFNGTLSDDEPLLFAILSDPFAEQGRPLSREAYFDRLAGLSDPGSSAPGSGVDHPAVDTVLERGRHAGMLITRAASPDGRFAFTLYAGAGEHQFIHALDTVGCTAPLHRLPRADGLRGPLPDSSSTSRRARDDHDPERA